MRKLHIIVIITLGFNNSFSQSPVSSWFKQPSGTTINLYSVKFSDSQTGWCVGDSGIILHTSNAGMDWTIQSSGVNQNLKSISFPSENIGFAVGDSGLILKTINGGNNWFVLKTGIENSLNSVFFVDESLGYTGGQSGNPVSIYKTSNGLNWDSIVVDANYIVSIFFLNSNTGWATMGSSGVVTGSFVSKTTNGGLNWTVQYSSSVYPPIRDVFFIDTVNGWLSYKSSVSFPSILRTTNGGINWNTQFPGTGVIINSLYFTDRRNGWGVGENSIIQATTNGGINWYNQTLVDSGKNYRSVYFVDSLLGWCVGDGGMILKTTTGGILTGFSNSTSQIPDRYFLSQNYPNPFNPVTNISFGISKQGFVSLKVYDVLGNEVSILKNENMTAGNYELIFDGSDLPSGMYFYRLEVDLSIIDTKRMLLLK